MASGVTASAVEFHINTPSAATFSEIQEQPVYVFTVADKQTHVALMRPVRYNWAIEVRFHAEHSKTSFPHNCKTW